MKRNKNKPIDFEYYKPINENQKQFHESSATNKLLIGAYRAGKTYPAIHEALFICFDNPGHQFLVARNTWDSLKDNVEREFIDIAKKGNAVLSFNRNKHDLLLRNGTVVHFRPLTLSRAQFKGMNLCGFYLDDPDVKRFKEVISFLFTRLTNPHGIYAKYFETIICANYEGHDWLWKTYMRRREAGGNGMFAYWFCKTTDNNTLPEDYIRIQESIHSKTWMDRYIYGVQDSYAGLVYSEYDPKVHDADLEWCRKDNQLQKIMVIDLGITHPTVVLDMAIDSKNVYIYDEWYRTDIRTADLGRFLLTKLESGQKYIKILIDPKSCAKEQQTGVSPRKVLRRDFGINTTIANNAIMPGVEIVKGLLTIRENNETHLFVDPERCPNTIRELEMLSWKSPMMMDFEDIAYEEALEDKDDDCTDCVRYGCVFFKNKLKLFRQSKEMIMMQREREFNERVKKLKMYREYNPEKLTAARLSKMHREGLKRVVRR